MTGANRTKMKVPNVDHQRLFLQNHKLNPSATRWSAILQADAKVNAKVNAALVVRNCPCLRLIEMESGRNWI